MPPEVIFILILIIFSILESALRGKRRSQGDFPTGGSLPPGWPGGDEDRTTGRFERGGEGVAVESEPQRPRETAEEMVPDDIWEEMAALARGDVKETLRRRRERGRARTGAGTRPEQRTPRRPVRPPRPVTGRPTPPVRRPHQGTDRPPSTHVGLPRDAGSVEAMRPPPVPTPAEEETGEELQLVSDEARPELRERIEHKARVEKQQRLEAERVARARHDRRPASPIAKGGIVDAGLHSRADDERLHRWFRGTHALRHAVIAREVLGRPLALRDYGDEELWSQ